MSERTCSCGRSFTRAEFLALKPPVKGSRMDLSGSPGEWLELRNCHCGTTLALPGVPDMHRVLDHAADLYFAAVRLLDDDLEPTEVLKTRARLTFLVRSCRP